MGKNPVNESKIRDSSATAPPEGGTPNVGHSMVCCLHFSGRRSGNSVIPWLRVGLGLLFIYSGATKAWDPAAFAADIANYRLIPWPLTAAVALYLPWLEIAAGTGMFFSGARRGGLLIISSLLLVFSMALASAWLRNLNIHCGCFGGGGTGVHLALARNVVLLAACAFVAVAGRRDEG